MKGRRRSSMGRLKFNLVILPVLVILALLVNAALSDDNVDPASDSSGPVSGDVGENGSDPGSGSGGGDTNDGEKVSGKAGGSEGDDEDDGIRGADPTEIKKFIDAFCIKDGITDTSCTYDKIVTWFDDQTREASDQSDPTSIKRFGHPRLFPFCVTHKQISDRTRTLASSHLNRFIRIFEGIELRKRNSYIFDKNLHSTTFNKTFVTDMKMTRINTHEPDMVNMRQWVHITIKTNGTMQGLFMQSIVGPFGLPFGEFNVDFPCKDLPKSSNIKSVGQLAYCSYRPKTNIVHPNVYVGYKSAGQDEWHVHFKHQDITCMETSHVQFAMIVVKKFDKNPVEGVHYTPILSPVFYSYYPDIPAGSPYPYYPEWSDKMYCNIQSIDELKATLRLPSYVSSNRKTLAEHDWAPIKLEKATTVHKIQPNEEYDQCIRSENRTLLKAIRDDIRFECPPGPFRCDMGGLTQGTQRLVDIRSERNISECKPCGAPECLAIFDAKTCGTELEKVEVLENEQATLIDLAEQKRERSHGAAGISAFLFVIPLGNFVARFYKDAGGRWLLGNGPWIFVHAACSVISLVMTWASIGHMVPNLGDSRRALKACDVAKNETKHYTEKDYEDCKQRHQLGGAHQVLGFFTIILLHIVPFFGFVRPSSSKLRFIFSAIHSHMGYLIYISGVITILIVVLENHCSGGIIILVASVIIPIVSSIAAIVIDVMMDRKLEIKPMRKQWPVYEQVELEKRGPFELIKWVMLGLFIFFLFGITCMAVANTYVVEASQDANFKNINALKHENGFLGRIQMSFGANCTPPKADRLTKKALKNN